MATKKEKISLIIRIAKLSGLLVLPFLISMISLDTLETKHSICLFKNIFGIECYGCGITKAVIAATQFDFVRAFNYNGLIVIVIPLILYLWGKEIIIHLKKINPR